MSAERFYRLLLRAYPPEFRADYGGEMVLLFRDQCRESDVRSLGFWARVLCDVARSAPTLRMEAWRANNRTMEVTMKVAAILTGLLGVFGIANAAVEWVAGSKGANEGTYELAVVLGVFASVLLLGAAVAILLQTRWGRQPARLALVASVVLFVAARLLFHWMSYFSQLVGFGLPVALLIALYRPSKPSTFGAASIVLLLVFGLSVPAAVAQAKPGDTVKDLPLTAAQRQSFVGTYTVWEPSGAAPTWAAGAVSFRRVLGGAPVCSRSRWPHRDAQASHATEALAGGSHTRFPGAPSDDVTGQ